MDEMSVLLGAIQKLDGIQVPVVLAQQITVPILEVSGMLKKLYKAKTEVAEKEKAQKKKADEEEAEKFDY